MLLYHLLVTIGQAQGNLKLTQRKGINTFTRVYFRDPNAFPRIEVITHELLEGRLKPSQLCFITKDWLLADPEADSSPVLAQRAQHDHRGQV